MRTDTIPDAGHIVGTEQRKILIRIVGVFTKKLGEQKKRKPYNINFLSLKSIIMTYFFFFCEMSALKKKELKI